MLHSGAGVAMARVAGVEELDVDWLRSALARPDIAAFEVTPIGAGQVANCFRLCVTHDDTTSTYVLKAPSHDVASRTTAAVQHLYEREVSFYRDLAPTITMRTPHCFHAERDVDDNFLLILEDLSPSSHHDQFDGLGVDTARVGLDQLARLHGPTHARVDLHQASWLEGVANELRPLYASVLPMLFSSFFERYDTDLDDVTRSLVHHVHDRLATITQYSTPVRCVTHGDFRTDNLLIDARDGEVAMAVLDWQTVAVASPVSDVAYFLTTSLTSDTCAEYEDELLEHYRGRLATYGLDLDAETVVREYARYTLQPIIMLVAASGLVERTPRGDQMFLTMIQRGVAAATRRRALEEVERDAASR